MKIRGVWMRQFVSAVIVAASWLLQAILYSSFPDPVPTHWNIHFEADGFTPKPWGAFVMPIVISAIWALAIVAWLGRRRLRIEPFTRTFGVLQCSILGFFFVVGASTSLARSASLRMKLLITALGILFVVLGNYMGKLTPNALIGVRTPWTGASPEVWLRANRFGGRVTFILGLGVIAMGLAGLGLVWLLAGILFGSVVIVAYSYVSYRGFARRG